MQRFLLYTLTFALLIIGSIVFVFYKADGTTDSFYVRFTSPKQSSLILGTSRAAQGLDPSVMNETLVDNKMFNYAFSIAHSPFGPTYLRSIKRKLDHKKRDGVFVLTVDPWSISSDTKSPNDSLLFQERDLFLEYTKDVTSNPNFSYLLNAYNDLPLKILYNQSPTFLHDDGWLELSIPMDSTSVARRIDNKISQYSNRISKFGFSEVRVAYLTKTIDYLREHGSVYLVRLPIHPRMMELDNRLNPKFNDLIQGIAKAKGCPYLDLTPFNTAYQYTDGNHLYPGSVREVSQEVAQWVQTMNSK